jgi:hypothetical protein
VQVLPSSLWHLQAVRGNQARRNHFLMKAQALEQGRESKRLEQASIGTWLVRAHIGQRVAGVVVYDV